MPTFISKTQAAQLQTIVKRYKKQVKLGKSWDQRTEDQLWRKVLGQIVVIGRAEPGERLQRSPTIGKQVSIRKLQSRKYRSDRELQKYLHDFLLRIHAAYVGRKQGWRNDWKAEAAVRNFRILMAEGGPRQFFQKIANCSTESEKIKSLQRLKRFGNKGARDTLIELRLAEDCMALDARIYSLLGRVGVMVAPDDIYAQIEKELIAKVARPSKVSGALLDRMFFQKYREIVKEI